MNFTVVTFLIAGALLVAGVVVRERTVPESGSIGRDTTGWLLSGALAVWVLVAAVQTVARLGELSA